VIVGCIFTDVVAWFIIVACAATLYVHGNRDIRDAADAAQSLRPLAGDWAYILFALGLFNASLFAASILPLSTAYTVCEGLGFESGVERKFSEAPAFYWLYTALIVAGGAVILIPGLPLIKIAVFSQVVNGAVLPFVLIFHAAADQQEGFDGRVREQTNLQHHRMGHYRGNDWIDDLVAIRKSAWRDVIGRKILKVIFPAARSFTSPRSASRKSSPSSSFRVTQRISRKIRFSNSPCILAHFEEAKFDRSAARVFVDDAATSVPTSASMPSSSSSSRRMASRGCSPSSILPPGNSHLSGMGWCRVLWQARMRSSFTISAATTRFMIRKELPGC
jgi:hypothetical protein